MIGIYKFQNKINDNIYIGQSIDIEKRYKDHINRSKNKNSNQYNSVLHQAIRKYGIQNFTFEVIQECSKEILNEREKYWIQYYDSFKNGYNCTSGGDEQESTKKFDQQFIKNIQQVLIENQLSYQEIHKKYKISLGKISEINTGKVNFNNELKYPLRKRVNTKKEYFCKNCGIKISKDAKTGLCYNCYYLLNKKNNNLPNRNELKQLIRTKPFVQIGKIFNVSDNAIRKWCIKLNLPRTKKEINSYSQEQWQKI